MPSSSAARPFDPAPRSLVLVVEDDANACAVVVRALEAVDCDVLTATSLAEALAIVATRSPRAVVLDLRLKDARDLEAFEAIRAHIPANVIIVSGFLSTEITVEAMAQGALHVFEKPFKIDPFVRVVKRALAKPLPAARRSVDRTPSGRLVSFILMALEADEDLKTNGAWARCSAVSVSTLTATCYLARIRHPHDARDLMRVLSARVRSLRLGGPLESHLDVADPCTLDALIERAGIAGRTATATIADILDWQQFVPNDNDVIRLLREALGYASRVN